MIKKIICLIFCIAFLCSCASKKGEDPTNTDADNIAVKNEIISYHDNLTDSSKELVTMDFLCFLEDKFGQETLVDLCDTLKQGKMEADGWYTLTKNSEAVLRDMYSGALDKDSPNYRSDIKVIDSSDTKTVIRIVGDVSFADNWHIAPKIKDNGLLDVMSQETLDILRSADIFLANNEFTYSQRGTPLNKAYTFRAHPDRVNHMLDMGADIVSLANNHAYDFGADAFEDTLTTLKNANLPYIGGGKDIAEAAKPYYFIVNGRKYAFSAATRAEKNIRTPEATETSSGVMRTYDPAKYIETIKTAEKECDYNIVYVHWGAEGYHHIEDGLYEMGGQYIDAGADIVVGAHAHVLQGVQYYKGIPIIYNLGNFLFNAYTADTGIFEINISEDGKPSYKFIPAIQKNCYVKIAEDEEKERILSFMEELSINVNFDSEGFISEKE